jgi:type I restriction enzyme S subunit
MLLRGLAMGLNKIKITDIAVPLSRKSGIPDLTPYQVSGINKEKEFFEPSRQVGSNTSNYLVVPPRFFACNLMHVGRDVVLPIAYNHSNQDKYVSPAYTVFRLKDNCGIMEEYFFMMLKSDERDRFFWFHSDSSVRDGMTWSNFCDIEISVPNLPTQQKYVAVYKAMEANQQSYEQGLEDLKLACDALLDKQKHIASKRRVCTILSAIDQRNSDGAITDVQGINITKKFMPSVANTVGVNLKKYKVVQKGQFAYSGMQTGRDKCIRIALYTENKPIIISPAYTVMNPSTESVLPEYVMVWFSRKESDRLGWYMSDSSVRSNLDLDRFFEIEIPVPSMQIQKAIAEIFAVYNNRWYINEKLKAQLNSICPILIRGSLSDGG